MPPVATPPAAAEACSRLADTRTAALEVAERLDAAGLGSGSVLLCFLSFHHTAAFPEAMEMLRRTLSPASLLATTAAAIVAGPEEFEAQPALAA
ncbi:MAG: hypothetical protein ACO38W_09565, partial [Phycisphaerales bacterium]